MADEKPLQEKRSIWLRLLPLFILVIGMVLAYVFGITDFLSYENIQRHYMALQSYVAEHYILSPAIFVVIYFIAIALSVPGGALLTMIGGFLFAQPWSTIYVVIAATCGATLIFSIASSAIGSILQSKAAPFLAKMEKGFNENAASYLLFLRLIPAFPFWLVNVAPAFFNVKLWTYVWTTFIGIIPGSFVFTQAGRGLGAILESEEGFSLNAVLNTEIIIALVALAIFALVPILVKAIRKKRNRNHDAR